MMDARQATLPWQCSSIPVDLQRKECTTSGKGKRPDTSTVVEIHAYAVPGRIRQARAAVLSTVPAVPPNVLNFVVFPEPELELPVFGADFVALPGGHLIVLDFQPMSSSSLRVAEDALKEVHFKYKALLPPIGGEIPEAARSFFSPYFLFVRAEDDGLVQTVVFEAFRAYFSIYLDLVEQARPVPVEEEGRRKEMIEGHKRYATYRAVNDPARGMLTRMYGEEWTERLIYEVLFDQAERKIIEE
ncbi:phycoerythrobilin:ferredoxin oxidoreductase [Nannochloropsis oceanica]